MNRFFGWLLLGVVVTSSIGCDVSPVSRSRGLSESRVTHENFLKIENGMTYQDVKVLLGAPYDDSMAQRKYAIWLDGSKQIRVQFNANGRVIGKSKIGL